MCRTKQIINLNAVPYGSTAKIMLGIDVIAKKNAIEFDSCTASGYSTHPLKEIPAAHRYIGGFFSKASHLLLSTLSGYDGCFSYDSTRRFIKKLGIPKLLHLHNLHCYYLNFPLLFRYIKDYNIPVIWTLHDCWAFTGHCPCFTMAKCDKWKTGCHHCPQYREYPKSLIDNSRYMYRLKKKWFTGVPNLTIVTPSHWLAGLVKESFLKDYPVKVIHNGIDLSVFKPTESDFRARYGCEDKFILLGVAFDWGKRKGLDVFIELSKHLDDRFRIVLVGTNDKIDRELPPSIISIHRTQNQNELAEIYSAADLFVNPTREEVFGLVNVEALACGTPVVTFRTGGSPEMLDDTCGSVVDCDDLDALESEIKRIERELPYSTEACLAKSKEYDMNDRFAEYIDLYHEVLK